MGGKERKAKKKVKRENEQRGEDGYSCETVASNLRDEQEAARNQKTSLFHFSSIFVTNCTKSESFHATDQYTMFYSGIKECLLIFRFCKLSLLLFPAKTPLASTTLFKIKKILFVLIL